MTALAALSLAALGATVQASNTTVAVPTIKKLRTIAAIPGANLRDPSSPVFDTRDGLWHFWATHVVGATSGYSGRVWHFYAPSLDAEFNTSGEAVGPTAQPGHFDSYGVFTPSAFLDSDGQWSLFYGGVATGASAHAESIGRATASSAFGPWTKDAANPVVPADGVTWCGGLGAARVDEAEPYLVESSRVLLVKTVCRNFTALPVLYSPKDPASSWDGPYSGGRGAPVVPAAATDERAGFEQARVFPGPDGRLHMTGNDHGRSRRQPHFTSTDGSLTSWKLQGYLQNWGTAPVKEPTPVWNKGATPGDSYRVGVPTHFLQFTGSPFHVDLMECTWKM